MVGSGVVLCKRAGTRGAAWRRRSDAATRRSCCGCTATNEGKRSERRRASSPARALASDRWGPAGGADRLTFTNRLPMVALDAKNRAVPPAASGHSKKSAFVDLKKWIFLFFFSGTRDSDIVTGGKGLAGDAEHRPRDVDRPSAPRICPGRPERSRIHEKRDSSPAPTRAPASGLLDLHRFAGAGEPRQTKTWEKDSGPTPARGALWGADDGL